LSINPARFGLITNEYRYREVTDSVLASRYEKARELDIKTNLDVGLINQLIIDMFGVLGAVRRRFIIELKGTTAFSINDFTERTPPRIFHAPELGANNLPVIVTRLIIDEDSDITTIEVWG
jgi:hypothetical protein